VRLALAAVASVVAMLTTMIVVASASAQPAAESVAPFGTQRGPDPTLAMIEASSGPFATAQQSVAPGNGFNGGEIYYPTSASQGTWGALVIIPGYTARCVNQPAPEEAWMGPWISSFGFVVLCMETDSPTDFDVARGQEALAALKWLTTASPVRSEIDPNRLAVMGHSMGGGGMVYATEHQPSLRAGIGLAPFSPSQNFSSEKVPTLVLGGQDDPTVTPSMLASLYATMPASTQSDFAQIAGADHEFYRTPNNVMMKLVIPWLKIFVDSDTRYEQFLCPSLPDPSTISEYHPKCPYVPPGGSTSTPTGSSTPTTASPTPSTPPTSAAVHAVSAGKCLDVPNRTTTAGTQLEIWDCNGGTNQQWTHDSSGELSVYSGTSRMCLDASNGQTTAGTKAVIASCSGASDQQWKLNSNGTITSAQSGLCLDVTGNSTADGALVELWTCNGGSNQRWSFG
jgi:predicted esterase